MSYPFEALPLWPAVQAGTGDDYHIYTIVEQAAGAAEREHWDEAAHRFVKTGLVMSVPFPVPYGWIPQTRNPGDGAALDVLLLTQAQARQGDAFITRPVGVLLRRDLDHKVLAVDVQDAHFGQIRDYTQAPEHLLAQIADWFRPYFILDGWGDAASARQMIEQAHAAFLGQQ